MSESQATSHPEQAHDPKGPRKPTQDENLLNIPLDEETLKIRRSSDSWRVLRILGEFVWGFENLQSVAGGVSIFAPNWGWRNVSLLDLVQTQLHLPILLDNGAQAMALAEMWFGAGKGINNLVVLLVGTGIGSGVITDGKLYRGVSNSAGEWGHTCIAMNGRPCRCGSRGCIEAYAGAPAIIEQIRERAPVSALLNHGSQIEILRALGAAARKGDPLAVGMMDEIGATLGTGIGNLINLFNPQLIVLGGWAGTLLGADLLSRIQAIVGQVALDQPLANTSIRVSALGWDAVSLGAATLALQAFLIGEDITMRKKVRHP